MGENFPWLIEKSNSVMLMGVFLVINIITAVLVVIAIQYSKTRQNELILNLKNFIDRSTLSYVAIDKRGAEGDKIFSGKEMVTFCRQNGINNMIKAIEGLLSPINKNEAPKQTLFLAKKENAFNNRQKEFEHACHEDEFYSFFVDDTTFQQRENPSEAGIYVDKRFDDFDEDIKDSIRNLKIRISNSKQSLIIPLCAEISDKNIRFYGFLEIKFNLPINNTKEVEDISIVIKNSLGYYLYRLHSLNVEGGNLLERLFENA